MQPTLNPLFNFSLEEDRQLTASLYKFGYGAWELIRNDFRNSNLFRLNWVAKSRSILDITRRCEYLIARFKRENAIEKELEDELLKQQKKSKAPLSRQKSLKKKESNEESKNTVKGESESEEFQ